MSQNKKLKWKYIKESSAHCAEVAGREKLKGENMFTIHQSKNGFELSSTHMGFIVYGLKKLSVAKKIAQVINNDQNT